MYYEQMENRGILEIIILPKRHTDACYMIICKIISLNKIYRRHGRQTIKYALADIPPLFIRKRLIAIRILAVGKHYRVHFSL
jgi:hypothetical protein